MRTLFLIVLLIIVGCGKSEPNPNEPLYQGQLKPFAKGSKGSLKYILFKGVDNRNFKEQFIKINLSKLKDFSFHSGLILNFTKESQEYLKNKIIDWDEFQVIFKFDSKTPKVNITLDTTISRKVETINQFSKVRFHLTEEEKHQLWSAINPIDLTFLSREKDLIKKVIILKSKELHLNGSDPLIHFTTYWIDKMSCSLKHSVYVPSNSRYGPSIRLDQKTKTYSQESCLEFAHKIYWKDQEKESSFINSPWIFHSDDNAYLLQLKPRRDIDTLKVGKNRYIDKDHINWFKARLTWFE